MPRLRAAPVAMVAAIMTFGASAAAQQAAPAAAPQRAAEPRPAEDAPAQGAVLAPPGGAELAPPGASADAAQRRLVAVEAELQRQRAELQAQRDELAAQRAELERRAGQAAAEDPDPELAGLMEAGEGEVVAELKDESAIRIYGFADVGLQRTWGSIADLVPGGTRKTTFALGNVNLYFDANPARDWRFLTEVRLGLFPHGSNIRSLGKVGALPAIDNTISDDGSSNGGFTNIVWNGVVLERAHIDWTPRDDFNLRAGWFLTPAGIWNVDHGSPTRLVIEPPMSITLDMLPQRQLGVEAFGQFQALPWTLGYNAYVSNGRQPGQLDYEDAKAVGGRLWARTRHPAPMTYGVSGYTGHFEREDKTTGLGANGLLFVTTDVPIAYRDYAAGADASIDIGALRIRSEGLMRWKFFDEGKRTTVIPGTVEADSMTFGAYTMVAYQLPWYGIEPVVMGEFIRLNQPVGEYAVRLGGGFNFYLSSATTLRTSYVYSELFDIEGPHRELPFNQLHSLASRLIIAF